MALPPRPRPRPDFIFAVIGEELGLIGTLAVLGLFTGVRHAGVHATRHPPDRFGTLLAAGITVWVVAQAAVNIGGVVGLLPVSGVPLPVRVVRRVGAGVHDARHGHPRQRHPPRSSPAPVVSDGVRTDVFALVTGGGTGGHVYPALYAVAEALVAHRPRPVRDPLPSLRAAASRRPPCPPPPASRSTCSPVVDYGAASRPTALRANAATLAGTARAFPEAWGVLRRSRPRVVLGVGGYASLPCVVGARAARIPTVVHEQNATPGAVNRLAVSWARTRRSRCPRAALHRRGAHRQPRAARRPSPSSSATPTRRIRWSSCSGGASAHGR